MAKKYFFHNQKKLLSNLISKMVQCTKLGNPILHAKPSIVKSWWKEGILIELNQNDAVLYNDVYRKFELSEEGKIISCIELERIIKDAVFDSVLKSNGLIIRKFPVSQITNDILNELKMQTSRRKIIIPLSGIDLRINKLKVGDCTIFRPTNYWCSKHKITGKNSKFIFFPPKEPTITNTSSYNENNNEVAITLGPVCAEIIIIASPNKAFEVALEYLGQVMGFLWLYLPFNKHSIPYKNELDFGLFHREMHFTNVIPVFSLDGSQKISSCTIHHKNIRIANLLINKQTIADYNQQRFQKNAKKIFALHPQSGMVGRLRSGLYWYGKAKSTKYDAQKMLFLFLAMEAILLPDERGEIANILAESTALLLSKKVETRLAIDKDIKQLYNQRSNIVHGRTNRVAQSDVNQLEMIIWHLIIFLLNSNLNKGSYQEFSEHIKRLKYRCRN